MDNKNLFYIFLVVFVLLCVSFVYAENVITSTQSSPGDDTWNTSSTINFQFSCTAGNFTWFNASLLIDGVHNTTYGNSSGKFLKDAVVNISIPGLGSTTTKAHVWDVMCCGHFGNTTTGGGNCSLAAANFTIGTDTENPRGYLELPKSKTVYAGFPIKVSCHGQDSFSGLNNLMLTLTKPSGRTIVEYVESGQERTYQSAETGEAGTYRVDCKITDVSTRYVNTGQEEFNVYYRTTKASVAAEEPEGEITPEGEEAGEEGAAPTGEGAPEVKAPSGKAWIWIVVIVVIILVLYFVLKKKK